MQDCPTGPREPRSSSLTPEQEAVVVAFCHHTLLALDDCLCALQATIAHPRRSSLHRCLHRHGIGRLPDACGDEPARRRFRSCPIGHVPIDPGSGAGAGVPSGATCEGKLSLFVAVDRTSKLAFARRVERAGRVAAARSGRPRTSGGPAFTCASWWRPCPAASTRGSSCNGIPLDPPGEGRPCLRAHLRPALAPSTASSTA